MKTGVGSIVVMKSWVCGARGFIGSRLVKRLKEGIEKTYAWIEGMIGIDESSVTVISINSNPK